MRGIQKKRIHAAYRVEYGGLQVSRDFGVITSRDIMSEPALQLVNNARPL
jgi:hypothetical protein